MCRLRLRCFHTSSRSFMTPAAKAMRWTHSTEEFAWLDCLLPRLTVCSLRQRCWPLTTRYCASGPAPKLWTFVFAHEMCSPNLDDWRADAKISCRSAKRRHHRYSQDPRTVRYQLKFHVCGSRAPSWSQQRHKIKQVRGHNLGAHRRMSRI